MPQNSVILVRDEDIRDLTYVNGDEVEPLFYAKTAFKDDGEKIKYIKKIESIVRKSCEYQELIRYIRQDLKINSCSVLSNLSSDDVSIELHHAPLTLFDITEAVLNRRVDNSISFSTLNLAEEIIILHYEGLVGLTPLSGTVHELVHSGKMYVNRDEIIGNITGFVDRFEGYLSETAVEKFIKYSTLSAEDLVPRLPLLINDEKLLVTLGKIEALNEAVVGKSLGTTTAEIQTLKGEDDDPYLLQ